MAVAIADGPLGIEALHEWTPPQGIVAGGIPAFTLNNRASFSPLTGYGTKLREISGLHSLPEVTDEREQNLGRIGESVYDAQAIGKTVVYSGDLFGKTLQLLRQGQNAMRRTFGAWSREAGAVHALAQKGEGMMTITPHATYGTVEHVFFGRTASLEFGDIQADGPTRYPSAFRRPFVLTLHLADPRSYEETRNESTGNLDETSVFLTNAGSAPTDPVFKLQGVFTTDPVVIARGTEYVLSFEGLNGIADGLWVDFKARRAWLNDDDTDMTPYLSVNNSNWWDPGVQGLDPGANDIGVTGLGGVGTEWLCYWWDAQW